MVTVDLERELHKPNTELSKSYLLLYESLIEVVFARYLSIFAVSRHAWSPFAADIGKNHLETADVLVEI